MDSTVSHRTLQSSPRSYISEALSPHETLEESGGTPEKRAILQLAGQKVPEDNTAVESGAGDDDDGARKGNRSRLQREFGVLGCVAIIMGATMGAGIFNQAGMPIEAVDSIGTTLILWAVIGMFTTLAGLIYAEIGTTFPVSGGDASYLLIFYGPAAGFMFQLTAQFYIMPIFIALYANACAVNGLLALGKVPTTESGTAHFSDAVTCFGVFIIIMAGAICCYSSHLVNILATAHLVSKIVTVIVIVTAALVFFVNNDYVAASGTEWRQVYVKPSGCDDKGYLCANPDPKAIADFKFPPAQSFHYVFAVFQASYTIFFSYQGFSSANSIVEELRDPARTLPWGVVISTTLLTLLYLVLYVSYIIILPKIELECSWAVADHALNKVLKGSIPWITQLFVAYSVFGVLLLYIYCNARYSLVGARNGNCPKFFALIHYRRLTPIPSIILPCTLAIMLTLARLDLGSGLLFGAFYMDHIAAGLVVLGNIYWRIKRPEIVRPFKLPLYLHIIAAGLFILTFFFPYLTPDWTFKRHSACFWYKLIYFSSGLVFLLPMTPICWFFVHRKWTGTKVERALIKAENRIAIFLQKLFYLVEEDYHGRGQHEEVTNSVSVQEK